MNYVINFKEQLKKFLVPYKEYLTQCKKELEMIKQMANNWWTKEKIDRYSLMCRRMQLESVENALKLQKQYEDEDDKEVSEEFDKLKIFNMFINLIPAEDPETSIKLFDEHIKSIQSWYFSIQTVINSYENDKINHPIDNLTILSSIIDVTDLSDEEKSKILGMAIYFNAKYLKKHKNTESIKTSADCNEKESDEETERKIIIALSEYYNQDGSFKLNENITDYEELLLKLLTPKICREEITEIPLWFDFRIAIMANIFKITAKEKTMIYSEMLQKNNERLRIQALESSKPEKSSDTIKTSDYDRTALEELKQYYKNGKLISIPEDTEKFVELLNKCNLDNDEKKYILNLIQSALLKGKVLYSILEYLTEEQKTIYKKSVNLLNSLNHRSPDYYVLVQNIEELDTIAEMISKEESEENIQYLLSDIPDIIKNLKIACDNHIEEFMESNNTLLFLCNKDTVPYVVEDINKLDKSYNKVICSLIGKIKKENQSSFRKIKLSEQIEYNMYEVTNPKAHVAFVEIDSGIYVIIGADVAREGYKELINRLKANQSILNLMERTAKDPLKRDQLLKAHETFLPMVSFTNGSVSKIKFLQ